MAKTKAKVTKASLLKEIDLKLQDLNLLKSVLIANTHPKQADLEDYDKRFQAIIGR